MVDIMKCDAFRGAVTQASSELQSMRIESHIRIAKDTNEDDSIIEPVNLPEKNEFLAALEALARHKSEYIEFNAIKAQIRRASYLDHIEAGFTEEQALELCKDIV